MSIEVVAKPRSCRSAAQPPISAAINPAVTAETEQPEPLRTQADPEAQTSNQAPNEIDPPRASATETAPARAEPRRTILRNDSESLTRGNGSPSGTFTPRNSHKGSQPKPSRKARGA